MSKATYTTRRAFAESGMSYSTLSEQTDIPKSTLQKYVTGVTKKIPADELCKISRVLGVSPFGSMPYEELVIKVQTHEYLRTREDVMSWLIGYQGAVATQDMLNLNRLVKDGLVIW